MRYPLAYVTYGDTEKEAVAETLDVGQTTCGPRVLEFEQTFAQYVGRKYAVMVNSGSSADLLVAFGLGPSDNNYEVLLPAVTWPTQVWSCLMAGYNVRLVDVHPETLQMDLGDLERKINPNTEAIFPVHVLGNVGDMDTLASLASSHSLAVIEDCCEALGSRWRDVHVGNFGTSAAYSFFFSHLITTMEGGMVVTDSSDDNRLYRLWRSHGWEPKVDYRFWFTTWGLNIRPTELQGTFGCVQMTRLETFRAARLNNYARLAEGTSTRWPDMLTGITVLPGCSPSWHGFPLMVNLDAPFSRDELCRYLTAHSIENRPIVAGNLARQPAIQHDSRVICGDLPGADAVHEQGFYIGIASFDNIDGTSYVADVIDTFMHSK